MSSATTKHVDQPTDSPKYSPLALIALAALVIQNSGAVLIMRYSRSIPEESKYLTSTAVIGGEVIKCIISGGLVLKQEGSLAYVFHDMRQLLRSSVPALLYLVQNNLQYVAISNLHPATYQVTYQLKILSTALLSVLMLGRKLSYDKWAALTMLTFGVVLIVTSEMSGSPSKQHQGTINLPLGLICTLISTLSSGCAGIYFELMLKEKSDKKQERPLSIWERNLQLGGYSVLIGLMGLCINDDHKSVTANGFFYGWTSFTCFNVLVQASGGMVIAVVIKYTDNILKNFATCFSLVFSCIFSWLLFNMQLGPSFLVGVLIVVAATNLYSNGSAMIKQQVSLYCSRWSTKADVEIVVEPNSPPLKPSHPPSNST